MSDPYRVCVSGPLAPFAHGFADELSRLGYTSLSAGLQMHLMAHVDRWMAAHQLRPADLTGPVVERFLAHRRRAGYTIHCSMRGLAPLVAYLRSVGTAIPPAAAMVVPGGEIVERYRRYLLNERCVVPSTARSYLDVLAPFIDTYATRGWGELTAGEVTTFIVAECPRRSTRMSKELATAMRSFLRFLHVSGEISSSLSGAVPKVAGWKQTALPKRLEPEQVRALLGSCDRSTPVGRRDFAILTVLVRLGLRRNEVAQLQLADIDWRLGELVVRGKGDRHERLPLPADVGEVIAIYLRDARPSSALDRTVFVRVRAPHWQLSPGAVTSVVENAGVRAGVGKISAHRLRHTAASEMLRGGGTLEEIGQVLRHRSVITTAIYAKVDRTALRTLARPWPTGGLS